MNVSNITNILCFTYNQQFCFAYNQQNLRNLICVLLKLIISYRIIKFIWNKKCCLKGVRKKTVNGVRKKTVSPREIGSARSAAGGTSSKQNPAGGNAQQRLPTPMTVFLRTNRFFCYRFFADTLYDLTMMILPWSYHDLTMRCDLTMILPWWS